MEPQTPTPAPATMSNPSSNVLETKIPSTVVFALGILLFFMPFAELKCKQTTQESTDGFNFNLSGGTVISNTGFGLAIGKNWKMEMNAMGGFMSGKSQIDKDQPKQDPNYYAIVALSLGIIGFLLCLAKFNGASGIAMFAGILSAIALIGLRFDLDKKVRDPSHVVQKTENNSDWAAGLDAMKFELSYTSWYYIAIIAMLAAALLCYLRIKNSRTI